MLWRIPRLRTELSSHRFPTEPVLQVTKLQKSYGKIVALANVDLEIDPGEIVGLVGLNGAGKTTFMSILAGLRRADAGCVRIAGVDALIPNSRARKLIGFAPQKLAVYPGCTVRENLRLFGKLADLSGRLLRQRIDEVAELLSITSLLDQQFQFLSGGQQRRVHTAIALIHQPPLLLLDEPTANLDLASRSSLLTAVRSLAANGAAICYSTHYFSEVEELGASVAILDSGRIVLRGKLDELIRLYGISALELTFDGPQPNLNQPIIWDGDRARLLTPDPAAELSQILTTLASQATRLRTIEIVTPSLESVFLAATGQRYNDKPA